MTTLTAHAARRRYLALIGLRWLPTGLLIPVMVLLASSRGLSLTEAINQLIGNGADRCKGRQMPCHYTFKEGHYYGMSSVIGTQVTHAVGAAMAARIRGDDVVVLGYLGDGATSASDFHCGMNFAAVYKSPCVLFCQNNQWAISVPIGKQSATATLAQKGEAYGMPFERVDEVLALSDYPEALSRLEAGEQLGKIVLRH